MWSNPYDSRWNPNSNHLKVCLSWNTWNCVCFRVQTLDQANLTGPLYQWDWFTWCRLIAPESDLYFEARCWKFSHSMESFHQRVTRALAPTMYPNGYKYHMIVSYCPMDSVRFIGRRRSHGDGKRTPFMNIQDQIAFRGACMNSHCECGIFKLKLWIWNKVRYGSGMVGVQPLDS